VENDCIWIDVDAIISTISLEYVPNTKMYTLDEVDANSLKNSFIIKSETFYDVLLYTCPHMWRH